MRRGLVGIGVVLLATVFAGACSKAPAEAALKTADAAIEAVKPEAEKFAPAQWAGLQEAAKAAHDKFAAGDYKAALAGAQELPAKAKEVAAAAAAKREEMSQAFTELQASLPAMLQQVQDKVAELGKMRRLPKGIDKAKLEEINGQLPGIAQSWQDAMQAGSGGDLMGAVGKSQELKATIEGMMQALGIEAPAAAEAEAKN